MKIDVDLKFCPGCRRYTDYPPRYKYCPKCGSEIGPIFKFIEKELRLRIGHLKRNYCPECREEFDKKYKHCPYCSTELVKEDIFRFDGENGLFFGKWNDEEIEIKMGDEEIYLWDMILKREPPAPTPKSILAFEMKQFFDKHLESSFLNRGEEPPEKLKHEEVVHILEESGDIITQLDFTKIAKTIDCLSREELYLEWTKKKEMLFKRRNEIENLLKEKRMFEEELFKELEILNGGKYLIEHEKLYPDHREEMFNKLREIEYRLVHLENEISILMKDLEELEEILEGVGGKSLPDRYVSLRVRENLYANVGFNLSMRE